MIQVGYIQGFKNYRQISPRMHASGLPRRKDIHWLKEFFDIETVIDLSDRPRKTVEKACKDFQIQYLKFPINEFAPQKQLLREAKAIAISSNCLIHCYKGKHRTGTLLATLGFNPPEADFTKHPKLLEIIKNV